MVTFAFAAMAYFFNSSRGNWTERSLNVTLDSAGDVGLCMSIALTSDNVPVISYYDYFDGRTNYDLKLAICNDAQCSSPTIMTLDYGGVGGR